MLFPAIWIIFEKTFVVFIFPYVSEMYQKLLILLLLAVMNIIIVICGSFCINHCAKNVHVRRYSGPPFPAITPNTDIFHEVNSINKIYNTDIYRSLFVCKLIWLRYNAYLLRWYVFYRHSLRLPPEDSINTFY